VALSESTQEFIDRMTSTGVPEILNKRFVVEYAYGYYVTSAAMRKGTSELARDYGYGSYVAYATARELTRSSND